MQNRCFNDRNLYSEQDHNQLATMPCHRSSEHTERNPATHTAHSWHPVNKEYPILLTTVLQGYYGQEIELIL